MLGQGGLGQLGHRLVGQRVVLSLGSYPSPPSAGVSHGHAPSCS